MAGIHRLINFAAPTALLVGMLAMTACANSGNAATMTTTATCPSSQVASLTTITGTVTTIAKSALTIKDATGAPRVVHTTATTRYTRLQKVSAATLIAGSTVQILAQPSPGSAPTVAQAIIVQPNASSQGQSTSGFGQGIGGVGLGTSTTARCQGATNAASWRGLSGTITIYDATNQQLVVADAQGTPFLSAIVATTTIDASAQASQADVQMGATVSISAMATHDGVMARQIQILAPGQGQ